MLLSAQLAVTIRIKTLNHLRALAVGAAAVAGVYITLGALWAAIVHLRVGSSTLLSANLPVFIRVKSFHHAALHFFAHSSAIFFAHLTAGHHAAGTPVAGLRSCRCTFRLRSILSQYGHSGDESRNYCILHHYSECGFVFFMLGVCCPRIQGNDFLFLLSTINFELFCVVISCRK